jgi:hypothetical protein
VAVPAGGVFGASSVWKADISQAPTASNSAAQVAKVVEQVNAYNKGQAAFNIYSYGLSWYTVGATQATVRVSYTNCQHKTTFPTKLFGPDGQLASVPLPASAIPTPGTDASLTVYQPATDTLWDLWRATHDANGWHACWGGRIQNVSSSPGYFPGVFGTSASGLARAAGAVTVNDVKSGVIDHAITLALPPVAISKAISWPAQRTDGTSTAPNAIAEGTRLRLDPNLDVASLGLNPIATMIAKAAQKYGFILTDKSGMVAVPAEGPSAIQHVTGTDPWASLLGPLTPVQVFKGFPWRHLQALPRDYGKR